MKKKNRQIIWYKVPKAIVFVLPKIITLALVMITMLVLIRLGEYAEKVYEWCEDYSCPH